MGQPQFTNRFGRKRRRYPNAIRAYRLREGYTQKELASLVRHSRGNMSAWECGHMLPVLTSLFRIARVLHTPVECLYFDLYHPHSARFHRRYDAAYKRWFRKHGM